MDSIDITDYLLFCHGCLSHTNSIDITDYLLSVMFVYLTQITQISQIFLTTD